MGQIFIEFDNTLKQSEIVLPLVSSSVDEAGESYEDNKTEVQQTSVFGIQSPLISIGNIVIDFNDIMEFTLKSNSVLPELSMMVLDKYDLIASIDTPGMDNEVRIQILPQFDEAYKKINLTFYIDNMTIHGDNMIDLRCIYKLPDFTGAKFKSLGKLNTYNLFKTIAQETGLGFATNIAENNDDERYIYCGYKSYMRLLSDEIHFSGAGQYNIYDYWVDYWNNITLCNMYDRYTSIDQDEDIKIWISSQPAEINEAVKVKPSLVVANLNNHPQYKNSDLHVDDYEIITNSGIQANTGSDMVYSIYENDNYEYIDHFVQDGDIKKDVFVNFEYLGEYYGGYNYLIQKCYRESFMKKINSEYIKIKTHTPLLALMRGHKINFTWWINDSNIETKFAALEHGGYIDSEPPINIPVDETQPEDANEDNGTFTIDRQVTGQYLITATEISFRNNEWEYIITLNRPANQKTSFTYDEFKE